MTDTGERTVAELAGRVAALEERLAATERTAQRALDSTTVANVFARYQYLHNAFRDEDIIPLWVTKGTPGISAQYSNAGVYTDWDSVMAYHRGRPSPAGKLINHQLTMPVIEVAEDGETAKGLWFLVGTESGLVDPEVAPLMPPKLLSSKVVQGKHVWAHWVWAKYDITFLRQDGEWRIWKFRCVEVARTSFDEDWVSFAEANHAALERDFAYFGDDGRPVFMPEPDEPAEKFASSYRPDGVTLLDPVPPTPYRTLAQ